MNLNDFMENIKNSIIKDKDVKVKELIQIEIDGKNGEIIDSSKIRFNVEPIIPGEKPTEEKPAGDKVPCWFVFVVFILPFIILGIDYFTLTHWVPIVAGATIFSSSLCYAIKIYSIHDFEGDSKKMNPYARLNGQWLFFLASFLGWSLLYYFLILRLPSPNIEDDWNNFNWQWQDFLIIVIAFLGISGRLPYYIGSLIGTLKKTFNIMQ